MKLILLAACIFGSTAMADSTCRAVDLRQPEINRPQTQVFFSARGKLTDSGMCASFSSSLALSKQLGKSINPVDAAFQSTLAILSRSDKELVALRGTAKHAGYCRQEAIDAHFGRNLNNFVQSFNEFIDQLDPKRTSHRYSDMPAKNLFKIAQWLNSICGERIQTSLDSSSREPSPTDSAEELGKEVDRLLDEGQFVQYTHDYHQVTIVGRTEDCRYIIQDSIPESAWQILGGMKAEVTFEKKFFQYWPRATLLQRMQRISFYPSRGPASTCTAKLLVGSGTSSKIQ